MLCGRQTPSPHCAPSGENTAASTTSSWVNRPSSRPPTAAQIRAVWSAFAVTSRWPSGENARMVDAVHITKWKRPLAQLADVPDNCGVVDGPRYDPLSVAGERCFREQTLVRQSRGTSRPLFASQIRAVLSPEAVTTRVPSGENAAPTTVASCLRRTSSRPFSTSQIRAVWSADAVTTRVPSRENEAPTTAS